MSTTTTTNTMTDLLIVGGGPAGLGAASTFARVGRPMVLYDSGLYRNAQSPAAHTIPSHEGVDPAVWREQARKELMANYDWVTLRQSKIISLAKVQQGVEDCQTLFEAKDDHGHVVKARKVIIATGIQDNLPNIQGLSEIWGTRASHCIFCHGTETRDSPIGVLLPPGNKMNAMAAEGVFKLWRTLNNPQVHFLTHGIDVTTPQGLAESGLEKFMPFINKSDRYKIISAPLEKIEETPNGISIHFQGNHQPLPLGYLLVMPISFGPNPHAKSFLDEGLLGMPVSPMGTIQPPTAEDLQAGVSMLPPRMGDDPRTSTKGLFWAGNSGSFMANVNISVAQGQGAGVYAAMELGLEDMSKEEN